MPELKRSVIEFTKLLIKIILWSKDYYVLPIITEKQCYMELKEQSEV